MRNPLWVGAQAAVGFNLINSALNTTWLAPDGQGIHHCITWPLARNNYTRSSIIAGGIITTASIAGTLATSLYATNHLFEELKIDRSIHRGLDYLAGDE